MQKISLIWREITCKHVTCRIGHDSDPHRSPPLGTWNCRMDPSTFRQWALSSPLCKINCDHVTSPDGGGSRGWWFSWSMCFLTDQTKRQSLLKSLWTLFYCYLHLTPWVDVRYFITFSWVAFTLLWFLSHDFIIS